MIVVLGILVAGVIVLAIMLACEHGLRVLADREADSLRDQLTIAEAKLTAKNLSDDNLAKKVDLLTGG